MSIDYLVLVLVTVIAIPALWLLLKVFLTKVVPSKMSGRLLLIQQVRAKGGDVSVVPDAAWDEIVAACIGQAERMAALGAKGFENVDANLVRQLHSKAEMIVRIQHGSRNYPGRTYDTLVKYGVVK